MQMNKIKYDKINEGFDDVGGNKTAFTKILKYIIFVIGAIIILSVVFSGCDNLKCYPHYDVRGNYIGFKCGDKF